MRPTLLAKAESKTLLAVVLCAGCVAWAGSAAAATGDVVTILTQLSELRAQDLLTEEEFVNAKSRALGTHSDNVSAPPYGQVADVGRRVVGGSVAAAVVAGLFMLDSLWRISTLSRAQIWAWAAAGVLPCAAFVTAACTAPDRAQPCPSSKLQRLLLYFRRAVVGFRS